jgi:hypothetical protein
VLYSVVIDHVVVASIYKNAHDAPYSVATYVIEAGRCQVDAESTLCSVATDGVVSGRIQGDTGPINTVSSVAIDITGGGRFQGGTKIPDSCSVTRDGIVIAGIQNNAATKNASVYSVASDGVANGQYQRYTPGKIKSSVCSVTGDIVTI